MRSVDWSDKYLDPPDEPTHWPCDGCHEVFDGGDMTKDGGRWYCNDCLDDQPPPNDWRENLHARDIALAAKCQTIASLTARVEALEAENGKLLAQLIDLQEEQE